MTSAAKVFRTLFILVALASLNGLAQNSSLHIRPLGLANHVDSANGVNALVLIGSFCGWKGGSVSFKESSAVLGAAPELSPIDPEKRVGGGVEGARQTFNFRDPFGGEIPGKKKGCSNAVASAVHQTLQEILNTYLNYFGYSYAILIEYGVISSSITTIMPNGNHLRRTVEIIDPVTMQQQYVDEVGHLKSTLLWVAKNWTRSQGSLNVYFNIHSSPTHFFINQTPFLIMELWQELVDERIHLERSHWYFDTCWAGRVQDSVDNESDPGHRILSILSGDWTVGVSALTQENNLWLFRGNRAISPYSLAVSRAVRALSADASLSALFFSIGEKMQFVLSSNGHPAFHHAGFSIFDLNFARSQVYLIKPDHR